MDNLTPDPTTKASTVGSLLAGASNKISGFFSGSSTSSASGLASGGSTSSASVFMSPLLWIGAVVVAATVYLVKFRKSARKGINFRSR